jgi:hypothetical protein
MIILALQVARKRENHDLRSPKKSKISKRKIARPKIAKSQNENRQNYSFEIQISIESKLDVSITLAAR